MHDKSKFERVNSGVFKADFPKIVDKVKTGKQPIVIQKNNRDQVAIVPLELLTLAENKTKTE